MNAKPLMPPLESAVANGGESVTPYPALEQSYRSMSPSRSLKLIIFKQIPGNKKRCRISGLTWLPVPL